MRIIVKETAREASKHIADAIIGTVKAKPDAVLGLATGSSPLEIYSMLKTDHQNRKTDYRKVRTFNLDEYLGMNPHDPHSYRHYMEKNLFNALNIRDENTHLPDDAYKEDPAAYDERIEAEGGIDLQLLGIGLNGHIGFNEPGVKAGTLTHVTRLEESTRKANARFFESPDEVPTHAITMGIQTILSSRRIFLIATGKKKASIIRDVVDNGVNNAIPATFLKTHPDVSLILDKDAASML
ncbi:MAG: glucosamine-6-phosphate deaminase [Candidatus Izemoplasmataceae bacterium]